MAMETHFWLSLQICNDFWKHCKTKAKNSERVVGVHNLDFEYAFRIISETRAYKLFFKCRLVGPGAPRADPVDKKQGLEKTCAPHLSRKSISNKKRFKCEPGGGKWIDFRKTLRWSSPPQHTGAAITAVGTASSLKLALFSLSVYMCIYIYIYK